MPTQHVNEGPAILSLSLLWLFPGMLVYHERKPQSKQIAKLTFWTRRRMANSAQVVLPLPVGAATRQLSSVLYRAVNTCKIDVYHQKSLSGDHSLEVCT